MKKIHIPGIFILLGLNISLHSQQGLPTITIKSKALQEERIATVQVPAGYDRSEQDYPVL